MKKTNQSEVVSSAFVLVHTSHTHTAGLWWSSSSLASGPCQSGSRSSWPVWIQTGDCWETWKDQVWFIRQMQHMATFRKRQQKRNESESLRHAYVQVPLWKRAGRIPSQGVFGCLGLVHQVQLSDLSASLRKCPMQFPCHSALGAGETNERWAPWSNSTSKRSCASCWWGRQKLAEKMDQWSWRKVNLKSYFQIRTQLSIASQSWKALALRIKLAREDQDLSARQAFLVAAEHQAHLQLHTCTTLKWKTFYSWKGGRMW